MVYQSISIMEDGSDPFIIHERYKIIRHIGSGSSGTVCSAYDQQSQTFCAIKKIYNIFNKTTTTKRCVREIKCLQHFHGHPRIIELLDLNLVDNDLYLIFQCMDTSLHDVIHSLQPLYDIHYQWILYQLFSGLQYIHSANIVHRDLTPANILINKDCQIKIGDFGMAKGYPVNNKNKNIYLTEYVCTRWYRAPEIILNTGYYDQQIDTWSLGCIFGEILGRKVLFQGKDHVDQLQVIITQYGLPSDLSFLSSTTISSSSSSSTSNHPLYTNELLNMIYQKQNNNNHNNNNHSSNHQQQDYHQPSINFHELFPNCPLNGIDLLNQLLQLDPNKRITMDNALQHPFVNIFSDPEEESLHCPPLDLNITMMDSNQFDHNKSSSMAHGLILDQIHSFKQSFNNNHHHHQDENIFYNNNKELTTLTTSTSTSTSTSKLLLDNNNHHNHQDENLFYYNNNKELATITTSTSTSTSKSLLDNHHHYQHYYDDQSSKLLLNNNNSNNNNNNNNNQHYYNEQSSSPSSSLITTTTNNIPEYNNDGEDVKARTTLTPLIKNKSVCTECTESDMDDAFVLHHRIRNDESIQFMENAQWFMKLVGNHYHQDQLEFTLGRT